MRRRCFLFLFGRSGTPFAASSSASRPAASSSASVCSPAAAASGSAGVARPRRCACVHPRPAAWLALATRAALAHALHGCTPERIQGSSSGSPAPSCASEHALLATSILRLFIINEQLLIVRRPQEQNRKHATQPSFLCTLPASWVHCSWRAPGPGANFGGCAHTAPYRFCQHLQAPAITFLKQRSGTNALVVCAAQLACKSQLVAPALAQSRLPEKTLSRFLHRSSFTAEGVRAAVRRGAAVRGVST